MRFENRTSGVFEVLGVHLDADQSFDAGRLRQETLRLVEKGSRRIVVDLGTIEYLYSDSINAFVALNRRLLESSGRLGILVPHPKVHEILVRAGLENIMRLYRTEAELLGDSRELMRQSSAWTRPAELLNDASASQILSATSLIPRSGDAARDAASSTQRIPRRRTGPRAELKSRRHDGRRMDQPAEDVPLPPVLPGVGSESASLRNLSLDSSTFGLQPPVPRAAWTPDAPAAKPVPPVLPSAEPTVFQLPQDPEQDGYSTDAWLLALTSQPDASASRPEIDQDSSGFLPKLGTDDAIPARALSQVSLNDPPSQMDTDLRWEEEIPLTGVPKSKPSAPPGSTAPSKSFAPEKPHPAQENPFSHAFLDAPSAQTSSSRPAQAPATDNEALRKAIFHEVPVVPAPQGRSAPPPAPPIKGTGRANLETAEPTLVIPTVAPPKEVFRGSARDPSPSAAQEWFGAAKFSPPPTPPGQAPAVKPPEAPTKPVSAADDWFGSAKRSTPAATPAPQSPAPASHSIPPKVATPVEDWFGSAKRSGPAAPTPQPASHSPQVTEPKIPNPESKASSPAEDWFTQPAPRVMAPVRDRPAEADEWFGKRPTSAPAKPPAPVADPWLTAKPVLESKPQLPHTSAEPTAIGDEWFRQPASPASVPPSPRAPKPPARKPDSSFLDSDDFERPSSKRHGIGFWIAVLLGVLLLVGGLAVLVVGLSNRSPDVPPVTAPTSEAPSVPEATGQTPLTSAPPEEEIQDKAGPEATARAKAIPRKTAQIPTPVGSSVPAPPPEEDHAPVKVFVTSRPSGAGLVLDGKSVGTTPCEIIVKRNGSLDFSLAGYRTFRQAIDPDEIHGRLNVQLLSDGGGGSAGRIYISSSPSGAEIQYAGKTVGKTPTMVDLPTGAQKVTVKSGVQSQTKTLDIQSGTNPAENFSL